MTISLNSAAAQPAPPAPAPATAVPPPAPAAQAAPTAPAAEPTYADSSVAISDSSAHISGAAQAPAPPLPWEQPALEPDDLQDDPYEEHNGRARPKTAGVAGTELGPISSWATSP